MKITKAQLAQIVKEESQSVFAEKEAEALLQEINFMKKLANFARNGSSSKGWEAAVEDFAAEDDKADELVSQVGLEGNLANMSPEELAKKMATIVAAVQKSGNEELMAALQGLAQDGSTAMSGGEQGSSTPSGGGGEVTSTAFAEFSNLLSQIATKFEVDGSKLVNDFQAFLKGQGFAVEGMNEGAMIYDEDSGAPILGDLGDMIKKYEMFGNTLVKALQSKYSKSVSKALVNFGFGDVEAFLKQVEGAGEEANKDAKKTKKSGIHRFLATYLKNVINNVQVVELAKAIEADLASVQEGRKPKEMPLTVKYILALDSDKQQDVTKVVANWLKSTEWFIAPKDAAALGLSGKPQQAAGEEQAPEEAGEEATDGPVPLFKGDDPLYGKLYLDIKKLLKNSEWDEAAKNKQGLQTMVKSILKDLSSQLRANDIQVSESQISSIANLIVEKGARPVKGAVVGTSFNYRANPSFQNPEGAKSSVQVIDPDRDGKTLAKKIDPETCEPISPKVFSLSPDRVGEPIQQCSPKSARSMERGGAATMSRTDIGGRVKPTKGQIESGRAIAGKIHKLISDTYDADASDMKDIQKSTQKLVATVITQLVKPFLSKYLKGKDIQLKEDKFDDLALSLTEIMLVETLDASRGKNMMPKVSKALTEGTNKMKITKAQLSQIVQEELNNAMQEGIPSQGDYELGRQHALAVFQGEMAEEDTWKRQLSNEDYERGFDEQTKELDPQANWDDGRGSDTDDSLNPDEPEGGGDDEWMWENKITKSQLAQIVQEELKATLSEAYSDTEYDDDVDKQAYAYARDEALRSAIDDSLEDWAGTPAPIHEIIPGAPEGVNQIGWDEAGEEYLFDLVKAGDVVRVEGSPNDDWYGKEANLYVLAQ